MQPATGKGAPSLNRCITEPGSLFRREGSIGSGSEDDPREGVSLFGLMQDLRTIVRGRSHQRPVSTGDWRSFEAYAGISQGGGLHTVAVGVMDQRVGSVVGITSVGEDGTDGSASLTRVSTGRRPGISRLFKIGGRIQVLG